MIFIKNKAFTLIELLVWITIISIIILWATNIDYNRLSQKQKLEIFTNNIKSDFERIRNNSLAWKWIWTSLDIPNKWKLEYSKSSSWTVTTSTSLDNWATWSPYKNNIDFQPGYNISQIRCLELDWTFIENLNSTETWSIEIEWSNINLNCTIGNPKILELSINFRQDTEIITINSLNWLVEIK